MFCTEACAYYGMSYHIWRCLSQQIVHQYWWLLLSPGGLYNDPSHKDSNHAEWLTQLCLSRTWLSLLKKKKNATQYQINLQWHFKSILKSLFFFFHIEVSWTGINTWQNTLKIFFTYLSHPIMCILAAIPLKSLSSQNTPVLQAHFPLPHTPGWMANAPSSLILTLPF